MAGIAQNAASKLVKSRLEQYAPSDPLYDFVVDPTTGKTKKSKRNVPPGLSKRDEKTLRKIRKRAHYLDKGMNICGFRVGWTFWIGIIPGLGDIVDASLNYVLVVSPARELDLPNDLVSKMLLNNAISAGLGFIPLVGDIGLAAWRANSRNALLLESYLTLRGQEFLAQSGQGDPTHHDAEVRRQFVPGAGMGATSSTSQSQAVGAAPVAMAPTPAQPARRKGFFGGSSTTPIGNGGSVSKRN